MAGSLRAAFSLRSSVSKLLIRRKGRLGALDGLRAIAILATIAFHALWYSGRSVPSRVYFSLLDQPEMVPLWRGHFGVDAFFVLSGFLIAGMLIDERDRTGRIDVPMFYTRRLLRLWPALLCAALLDVLLIGRNSDMIWANVLYVSNFVPVMETAMSWTWSLAIEEQFYLVCPFLVLAIAALSMRSRLFTIASLALALIAIATGVVLAGDFHAVDSEIAIQREVVVWARGFDHLYSKPWMRAGPLLAGMFAALLYRMPAAMAAISRARVGAVLGLGAALAIAWLSTDWTLVLASPRSLEVAYLAGYRTVFGACVAYVLLLALSRHPVGQFLSRVLSMGALHPIAELAYAMYLVNPIATMVIDDALATTLVDAGLPVFPILLTCNVAATIAVALVLHLAIERPFMELRPHGR